MILTTLHKLYDRLVEDPSYKIAKFGYSPQKISFRILINPNGTLFAIQDARIKDDKGKLHAETQTVLGETKPSGSGLNPCLLCDNTSYLLGYKTAKKEAAKTAKKEAARAIKCFEASRDHHLEHETAINHQDFSAVCRFLENWNPERILKISNIKKIAIQIQEQKAKLNSEIETEKSDKIRTNIESLSQEKQILEIDCGNDVSIFDKIDIDDLSTNFGVFQVHASGQKKPVHEHQCIVDWWDKHNDELVTEEATEEGQCLITGEQEKITRLHPKIKSVAGAQSTGASIVSFNESAYESYGKTQSYNAPVSKMAAFKYGTVLNSLLNGPQSSRHRIRIGDTTCVFWTEKPSPIIEESLSSLFQNGSNPPEETQDEAQRSKIETFLKSLRLGVGILADIGEKTHDNHFYILGLAPNAARLSVRFFHQSTIAEFIENLRAHHQDIGIVKQWKSEPEYPANWQLLLETARVSAEIPPLLGGSLMRSILQKTNYPEGIYSAVIRRIRADRKINYMRAAIIKGTLTRNHNYTITIMLDTTNTTPAYLLGRLLSTLEKTQQDALGELNSGLRDKFYSSASATPASVFPRILRTSQHHLTKLEGGWKVNREKLLQEIMCPLTEFPSHLNLKEQGLFALGYYHQRKVFFTTKEKSE